MKYALVLTITLLCFSILPVYAQQDDACSSFLVTKGASEDGSVMITYNCDGEFLAHLSIVPAQDHQPDEVVEIRGYDGKLKGKIPQPSHTYAVVGLMNEHQLSIGETTFGGRKELRNPDGLLHYYRLMQLTLQRAKTAREAINVMADLVDRYGYSSTGESFSIADPNEAWIMEMIGPGPGGKGAVWVARRVPDGYVCAHANMARIGTFPRNDPDNCLYSKNVVSLAVEKGYYDPKSGEPFSFRKAYDPPSPTSLRYCAGRVWSMFRRCAPSLNLSSDFFRAVKGAKRYPLWIKPDKKLSVHDVMEIMRDHYEGTPFDMTKGVDAGPFGCPVRFRGIEWEVDGKKYAWERPISTQQTAFSFISQARGWLPNPIGGVYWYSFDDTYTNCYVPFYCSITELPQSYTVGSLQKFSWDSAWWVFNFVANFANLRYSDMVKDIQEVQSSLENQFLTLQPAIDKTALELYKNDPQAMQRYLTTYSVSQANMVVTRWKELAEHLITKYNDGYVKDEKGRPRSLGYPEQWLKTVIKNRPKQFTLPQWKDEKTGGRLY